MKNKIDGKVHLAIEMFVVFAMVVGLVLRYLGLITIQQSEIMLYTGVMVLVVSEIAHHIKGTESHH